MRTFLLFALITIYSSNAYTQTTSPSPYCAAGFYFMGNPDGSDWINSVTLGTLNNISNGVCPGAHYIFYNNLPVPDLAKNTVYNLALNFYVGGGAGYAAWIDLNHDNQFDSTELISGVTASTGLSLGSSTIYANIIIPSTALSGNTRMRIRISEDDNYHATHPGAYELACDPVDTAYGGETEDYTVNITSGTGVNELNNSTHLAVYPNPANDYIKIDDDFEGSLTYVVHDITGAGVLNGTVSKTKDYIDIAMLGTGLYFIELFNQGERIGFEKFIKQGIHLEPYTKLH